MPPSKKTPRAPKPKAPHTPYFVERYGPNWETKSLPRSWKSASTTAYNNPDWLEDRKEMWEEQKRKYSKDLKIYQHKLAEYQQAQFQKLRDEVVAQAAQAAKLKSAEYLAEKAAKAASAAARASARALVTAEREAARALKTASKPPTARDIRMAERGTKKNSPLPNWWRKSPKSHKTRKNRK